MNPVTEAARAAIAMLHRGWTLTEPAEDDKGVSCPSWSPRAVKWSLLGSISGSDVSQAAKLRLIGSLSAKFGSGFSDRVVDASTAIAMLERCIEA